MRVPQALSIAAFVVLAVWLGPRVALAQQDDRAAGMACMPAAWSVTPPAETLVDTPLEGVLIIPAYLSVMSFDNIPPATALQYVTVTVTDQQGLEIPGSLTYEQALSAIVWRAASPLTPTTTYFCHIAVDNESLGALGTCGGWGEPPLDHTFTFITGAEATAAVTAPEISTASLTEQARPITACCDTDPNQCVYISSGPADGCQTCWTDGYTYAPTVMLTWTSASPAGLAAYVVYDVLRVESDGTTTQVASIRENAGAGMTSSVMFDEEAAQYCVRILARSVVDGSEATAADRCVAHDALQSIERLEAPRPDYSSCVGPIEGGVVREEDDSCGCRVRRGDAGGAGPVSMLFACLALVAWRRRHGA